MPVSSTMVLFLEHEISVAAPIKDCVASIQARIGMFTHSAYNPLYSAIMPSKHASRRVLTNSREIYDPDYPDMSVAREDEFRYHVSLGLRQIALQRW